MSAKKNRKTAGEVTIPAGAEPEEIFIAVHEAGVDKYSLPHDQQKALAGLEGQGKAGEKRVANHRRSSELFKEAVSKTAINLGSVLDQLLVDPSLQQFDTIAAEIEREKADRAFREESEKALRRGFRAWLDPLMEIYAAYQGMLESPQVVERLEALKEMPAHQKGQAKAALEAALKNALLMKYGEAEVTGYGEMHEACLAFSEVWGTEKIGGIWSETLRERKYHLFSKAQLARVIHEPGVADVEPAMFARFGISLPVSEREYAQARATNANGGK